ncbi:molybdopterin-dependent oxidoreductase, partial [Staphylococcus aureus]
LKALGAALALVPSLGLVKDGWNGFNVLHMAASRMGGLMLGYAEKGGIADLVAAKPKLAFFLGADEVDFGAFADTFKVYIGHHGDKGA